MDCDPSFFTVCMQLDCSDFNHEKSCKLPLCTCAIIPFSCMYCMYFTICTISSVPSTCDANSLPPKFHGILRNDNKAQVHNVAYSFLRSNNILHITCFMVRLRKKYIYKNNVFCASLTSVQVRFIVFFQSGKHVLKWWWCGRVGFQHFLFFTKVQTPWRLGVVVTKET